MEIEPVYVGRAVSEIRRESRGLTQSQLAAKCGLGLQSLQNIEANRRGVSPSSLRAIAVALDVPVTYLFLLCDDADDDQIRDFQALARKSLGIETGSLVTN